MGWARKPPRWGRTAGWARRCACALAQGFVQRARACLCALLCLWLEGLCHAAVAIAPPPVRPSCCWSRASLPASWNAAHQPDLTPSHPLCLLQYKYQLVRYALSGLRLLRDTHRLTRPLVSPSHA